MRTLCHLCHTFVTCLAHIPHKIPSLAWFARGVSTCVFQHVNPVVQLTRSQVGITHRHRQ
jgi:hypothetical protein